MHFQKPRPEPANLDKNTMRLEDLKIGDRIKYYEYDIYGNKFVYESNIKELKLKYDYVITDNNMVNKKNIICKLESLPTQYKEIPIEKEETKISTDDLTNSFERVVKIAQETGCSLDSLIENIKIFKEAINKDEIIIPDQMNLLYSDKPNKNVKVPPFEYTTEGFDPAKCEKLNKERKEKSAPKSFKFEFTPKRLGRYDFQPFYDDMGARYLIGYTTYNGKSWAGTEIPMPDWVKFDKTYTIEIKEKE